MVRLVPLLLLSLGGCENPQAPPCSAAVVIGTVTFDCDAATLTRKLNNTNTARPTYPAQ